MGEIFISNFQYGMNTQRPRIAGLPGTLYLGENIQLSRGGDIERPYALVFQYQLPAVCFGICAVGGQLYTFGSVPDSFGAPLPPSIQYQQLQTPGNNGVMEKLIAAYPVNGLIYAIARFTDGNVYHYYNGTLITDWVTLAAQNGSVQSLAIGLQNHCNGAVGVTATASGSNVVLSADVPGVPFTASAMVVRNNGSGTAAAVVTQANATAVAEVLSTGTITISSGTELPANEIYQVFVGATELLAANKSVAWSVNNTVAAQLVAGGINANSAVSGYTAFAENGVITISGVPGSGATPNGLTVTVQTDPNVTASTTSMAGGVTATPAVQQLVNVVLGGGYGGQDSYTITINGVNYSATGDASATGRSAYIYLQRVYSPSGTLLEYCELDNFSNWSNPNVDSGAGFINMATSFAGSEPLVGAGTYIGQSAVFTKRNIQIYNLNTDAALVTVAQTLYNTGAQSPASILAYGTTDLLYLDAPGIRSLRARDASGEAFVNTLGSPIDSFVQSYMTTLTEGVIGEAVSVVEPVDGRFWMALGDYIFILSYFPDTQINAWSYLNPGYQVQYFARCYEQLYALDTNNNLYLYGGISGTQYPVADQMPATVQLPFISTNPPSRGMLEAIDIACSGAWSITAATDPNNANALVQVGTVTGSTYDMDDITLGEKFTYVALNLTCSVAGQATISNVTLYHDGDDTHAAK